MKKIYFLSLLCLLGITMQVSAQTVVVSPTGDGGFATGSTFALNNWTALNAGTNNWYCGTVAAFAGSGAYIGNGSAVNNNYNKNTLQTSHLYRTVTIPAGASSIKLNFKLRMTGEDGYDRLIVFTAPTTFTPTINVPASNTATMTGAAQVFLSASASTYSSGFVDVTEINLPNSLAGTSFLLIFSWQNDGSLGANTAAAIDNISLKYCPAVAASATASSSALCAGSSLSLTSSIAGATSYSWTGPSSYASAVQNPPSFAVTAASAGIYTVSGIVGACTYTATTSSVSVSSGLPTSVTATATPNPVCLGATVTVSGTATGATSYSWSGPNSFSSALQNPASFTAAGASAGIYTFTASNACGGTVANTSSLVVNSSPTGVVASATPNPVCSGSNLTLSGTATGATTYAWSGPNGYTAAVLNPSSFTSSTLSAGIYTLVASIGSCSTTATTSSVVVNRPPGVISGSSAMWPSTSISLSNSVPGGVWSSSSPSVISVNSSTGVLTSGSTISNSTISYSTSCGSPATAVVSVFAATPITGSTTMCGSNPTLVTTESWEAGFPTAAVPYNGWTYSGTAGNWARILGSASATPACDPLPSGSGLYVARFNSNSIAAGVTAAIYSPAFSLVGASGSYVTFSMYRDLTAVTKPDSVSVLINTTASVTGATMLGSVARVASYATATVADEPAGTGWYRYTFYLPASFTGSTNYIIFNGTSRAGNNTYIDSISVVNTTTTTTLANATGSGTWSSSNTGVASVDPSGLVTAMGSGSCTISYTTVYGSTTTPFTVNLIPTVAGITASPSSLCAGATLTLTAGAISGTGSIVAYNWSGPDSYFDTTAASVNSLIPPTSASTGQYSLSVTYTGVGCTSAAKQSSNVTVIDGPTGISGVTTACPGSITTLSSSPAGGTWSSSLGSVATVNASTGAVSSVGVGITSITYSQTCGSYTVPYYVILAPATIGGDTTICGTSTTTIFSESWESGVPTTAGTAVDGWNYIQGTGAANNYWTQATTATSTNPTLTSIPNGTKCAEFLSYTYTANRTATLASPAFSLTGIAGAQVSFYFYRDASVSTSITNKYDSMSVFINTSMSLTGATYIGGVCRKYSYATSTIGAETAGGWYQYTLNIPASYTGSTNYLLFRGYSRYGDNMYLDNIVLKYTPFTVLTEATPGGTWTSSNTAVAQVNATGTVSAISAGTAIISYITPCGTTTRNITVTSIPTLASVTPSSTSICAGTALTLTAGTASGTTPLISYNWSGPGAYSTTGITATNSHIAADTTSSGVYSLNVTYYGSGCVTNVVVTPSVTVNSAPTDINGNTTICPATSSTLSSYPTGGAWTVSDPLVATINAATGVLSATGLGTATVTYTQACGSISTPVAVTTTPDPISGDTTLCYISSTFIPDEGWESGVPHIQGTAVDGWNYIRGTGAADNYWLQQTVAGASSPVLTTAPDGTHVAEFNSFNVTAGNSATIVSPSFNLLGYTGAYVSLYMYRDNGYPGKADSVSIYMNTSASLTGATRIGNICRSRTLSTTTAGTVPADGWYQYVIDIPATFTGGTNYLLLKATSRFGDNIYIDAVTIKKSTTSVLTETTGGGVWSTDNAAVADVDASGKVIAAGVGTTNISYTTPCGSTHRTINVNNVPSVASVTASSTTLCIGATLSLTAGTVSGSPTSYNWSGPGAYSSSSASSSTSLAPSFTSTGVYRLYVAAPGVGCISPSVSTPTVSVNAVPTIASITPSTTNLCAGNSVFFTAGAITGTGVASSYNWSGPGSYASTTASAILSYTPATSAASGNYSLSVSYPGVGCISSPVTSASVTVNDLPIVYNVTGGSGCSFSGVNIGLNNSQSSAVSYALRMLSPTPGTVTTLSGVSGPLSYGPITTIGSYGVVATGPGGCQSTMNGTDTVRITPDIALGAVASVCQPYPGGAVPVGFSGTTGPVSTYSIDWSSAANLAGFADVTNATVIGTSLNLVLPDSTTAGAFDANVTFSNGTCVSPASPAHFIVYAHPAVTHTTPSRPCVNDASSIVFTGTDSATVDYKVNGVPSSFVFAGTSYTLSTGAVTSAKTYIIQNAHNSVCSTPVNDTFTVNPIPMAWQGGTPGHATDWSTAANWTCGFQPRVTDNVTIGSVAPTPVITLADVAIANNLTLSGAAALSIDSGAVVSVKGTFTNNSHVSGSGRVVLNNSIAQSIKGNGIVDNLELANAAGATIDTPSHVVIGNTLYVTSGTLHTNDSLELASLDTIITGRIAPLSSDTAISGRVTVDQFIQGGYRRYRFWSHPFSEAISLSQIENYIDITGAGGTANGFTYTPSGAPSVFRLDPLTGNSSLPYDPAWKPFTQINNGATGVNLFYPGQGIRLFMRGAKGEGLGYLGYIGGYTPSATTIKMIGHVNQGPVTVTLVRGTTDTANQEYNMVGNPYPSAIDLGTIMYNAKQANQIKGAAFYLWDPAIVGGGAYVTVPIGIGAAVPYYMQANTSFQVRAHHDGATVSFAESNKVAKGNINLLRSPADYFVLDVYDVAYNQYDKLRFQFTDAATDNDNADLDATKLMNPNFSFYSLSGEGRKMAIDARPYAADKVIPLGVNSNYEQEFIIRADNASLQQGGVAYLHDKLLGKFVAMTPGAEYKFTISNDKTTQGDNRFELSLKPAETTTEVVKGLSVSMSPNPTTDNVNVSFTSPDKEPVSVHVTDVTGVTIYTKDLGLQQNGTVNIPLSSFASGIYMVELTQGSQKTTKKLVKE